MTEVDAAEVRRAMEYYYERGWTDGLPVIPVTESYLAEFMATTSRDPDEVLIPMPHLNKNLTVRLAAINAALAGCLPEYFPVVLAAWDAFLCDGMVTRSIWQSTTGTAPFVVVYGPVRQRIGLNSRGNVCGSGFRANATIGRAIRLGAINGLGLSRTCSTRPPRARRLSTPLHRGERGGLPLGQPRRGQRHRSGRQRRHRDRDPLVLHIEARHTMAPEQLAADLADTLAPDRRAHPRDHQRRRGAEPRARAAVRRGRVVQGRRAAGRVRARRPVLAGARGGRQGGGVEPDPVAAARRSPRRAACFRIRRCFTCSPRRRPCWWWWPGRATPGCRRWWRRSARGAARPLVVRVP